MRPIRPLPFGLIRNPASAALCQGLRPFSASPRETSLRSFSSLAREQPLPALSALHPSGLRTNAFRRHSVNRP